MNTPHPNLHYYQSTRVPKVGDVIATGKFGTCRVQAITEELLLDVRNLYTGEECYVFPDDCDWLEEIATTELNHRTQPPNSTLPNPMDELTNRRFGFALLIAMVLLHLAWVAVAWLSN